MTRGPGAKATLGLLAGILLALLFSLALRRLFWEGLVPIDGNVLGFTFPIWDSVRERGFPSGLPLWDPSRNLGRPFLADPICFALYPPLWLLRLIPDFRLFLCAWTLAHGLLAALFAFLLLREEGVALPSSLAAAVSASLGAFLTSRVGLPQHFAAAAWIFPALYALRRDSARALGLCLALQWLAGYPPLSLLTVLFLGLCVLLERERHPPAALVRGAAWGAALSAAQWLPFLRFLRLSSRGLRLDPGVAAQYSLPPAQLLKELFLPQWAHLWPNMAGDPSIVCFYAGFLALPLAAWAMARRGSKALAAAACLGALLSLGSHLPGYGALPLTQLFRFPAYWLFLTWAGLSLLGARGLGLLKPSLRWPALALLAADLLLFNQADRIAWAKPAFLAEPPAWARKPPFPGARVYHTEHLMRAWLSGRLESQDDYEAMRRALAPSYGSAFGWQDISAYPSLRLKNSDDYRRRLSAQGPASPLLDYAGAARIVTLDEGTPRPSPKSIRIWENPRAKARVFLTVRGEARLQEYRPGRVRASLRLESPGEAVFAESSYPGWRARLDGRRVAHGLFEGLFPSVAVPAGAHELEFSFLPADFILGALASLAALACWLARTARRSY